MKTHLDCNDPQLISGIMKFVQQFNSMKTTGQLASSVMHTSRTHRKITSSLSSRVRQWGKWIGEQATATGRRKYGSKGKGQVIAGRPRSSYVNKDIKIENNTVYNSSTEEKPNTKKKKNNLSKSIEMTKQIGG